MFHQHNDCILFKRFIIYLQSTCMHKQTIGSGSQVWVNKNLFSSSSAAFSEILRIKYFASEEIIDHDMHTYYPCTVYHKERIIFSSNQQVSSVPYPSKNQ